MKHAMRAFTLTFALLVVGVGANAVGTTAVPTNAECKKNAKNTSCKKKIQQKKAEKPPPPARKMPPVVAPSLSPRTGPVVTTSALTGKQDAMRDAFMECIAHVSETAPTSAVVDFVFKEQVEREESHSIRGLWQALRGSPVHHGHEVCLARAFGLRGFRNVGEVLGEAGKLLVEISSPYVEVVEKEIPPDRRFTRPWVRDYITTLARDMHEHFAQASDEPTVEVSLRVTSMIRSFDDQAFQVKRGRSPADCRLYFLCSTHTSGSSLDLGLKNVARKERAWIESRLIADQKARKIFFIIERSHYHVFVLPLEYMGEEQ